MRFLYHDCKLRIFIYKMIYAIFISKLLCTGWIKSCHMDRFSSDCDNNSRLFGYNDYRNFGRRWFYSRYENSSRWRKNRFISVRIIIIFSFLRIYEVEMLYTYFYCRMDPNPFQRSTFWTVTIGTLFSWTSGLASSQGSIQRFMSVPTVRDAQK